MPPPRAAARGEGAGVCTGTRGFSGAAGVAETGTGSAGAAAPAAAGSSSSGSVSAATTASACLDGLSTSWGRATNTSARVSGLDITPVTCPQSGSP